MEQPPPQHNWPSCKKRQWQLFIATRSPQPGCLWHPHPHCIVDLHASKDHPGEQLVINAWHCVGDGEELVRGLSSRAVSFCNSSRVSNWKSSRLSIVFLWCPGFLWLSTHFCSLQQPMRETVGNKNKKRVFCNTCCKQRRHCKREYIGMEEGSFFIYGWGTEDD